MAKMKVVVTDYIEDDLQWEAAELARHGIDFAAHQLKFKPEADVLEHIADADVVVVNMVRMTASLIAGLNHCRLIIRHGIGYDNVDVEACTRHGIAFAYQPDYCTEDVAEHAIALIMACARKIPLSRKVLERSCAQGQWDFTGLFPIRRLADKTLGVLGVGRIGSRVCRKMHGFGMRIIGHDPYLSDPRRAAIGIPFVDRDTLLRTADFVTVHTPSNPETRHLINAQTLALMKPTACLVNTARGSMVDTEALSHALSAGRLAGAALDVYDTEPPAPDFPLFGLENVILTPHIAWASEASAVAIRQRILEDILAAAEGRPPRCPVHV